MYSIWNSKRYIFSFSDDNANIEENSTNWKKGFFRLMFVLSILVGILGGTFFACLAKKGKLVDDEDPPPKYLINPKSAFLSFSIGFFGFVWLVYFIISIYEGIILHIYFWSV